MESSANRSTGPAKPSKLRELAKRILSNPTQLRVLLLSTIFGVWYVALYAPMTSQIDDHGQRAEKERKRLGLAVEIERLRHEIGRFEDRLPKNTDPNEWVQYMMNGLRGFDLRLVNFDTNGVKEIGPYKVVVLKLQVEGGFREVDEFLRWVEGNRRLFRVDSLKLEPGRASSGKLDAQMIMLGVMN
jgi:hypothetical protein